jgi:DNA polymerase-1
MYKNEKEFRTLSESGLKTLVPEFYKSQLPSFADVVGDSHFDELDTSDSKTINYACADADYALRLYHTFNNYFDRFLPNHRFIVEKIESPTAVYVGIMRYNGLPVDRQLMVEKRTEVERAVVQAKGKIEYIIGGNIAIGANASTSAFKKYLFETLQLPKMKTTEKEKDALDDETLILLKEWCQINKPDLVELFTLVQEYRHLNKIKSTYIDGYIKYISNTTRRLHPDLLPLTTETGRFASKNPNCQNMPRAGADDVGIRNFIAAPDGNVLLSLDFSQIELRVGAFYCKDEQMLETYKTGGDIHALTTAVIYKISLEEAMDESHPLYKERRSIAKNCNFGVFFGLFPRGLQKTLRFKAGLKVELDECEKIINNIKMGYPRLSRWQDEVKKRAGFRAYTETWLGRRRAIPEIRSANWSVKSFAERVAMNTPIQGTAADILKLALGRILRGLPERPWLKPLLQIHDELVFEIPENKVQNALIFVKNCMETQPFEAFSVPIIAQAEVGRRFGELKGVRAENVE